MHIILASTSPRRQELLAEAGYDFTVIPPSEDVECGVCSESGPAGLVAELAYRKASAMFHQLKGAAVSQDNHSLLPAVPNRVPTIILGADTIAECDGFILGKPRDDVDARRMLLQLSGREHRVLSGVCLIAAPPENGNDAAGDAPDHPSEPEKSTGDHTPLIRVAVTRLYMEPLTDNELNDYIESGLWEGKAGAFGLQDRLGWVKIVEGSKSNVVGLPLELLAQMISELRQKLN